MPLDAALAERAKAGVRFGNPVNATEAAALGRCIQSTDADRFAVNMLPVIAALHSAGIADLRCLAGALNARAASRLPAEAGRRCQGMLIAALGVLVKTVHPLTAGS